MEIARAYKTKSGKLTGTSYSEVYKKAMSFYREIEKNTKRRSYIRSAYFGKDKVFMGLFWHHLNDKLNFKDKTRRLKYFSCAIELIKNSKYCPVTKVNINKKSEVFHRFAGITSDNEIFFVQIKENVNRKQKHLISVFPLY